LGCNIIEFYRLKWIAKSQKRGIILLEAVSFALMYY